MAILKVLHYPNERLHIKAELVTVIDDSIKKLVTDLIDTMQHEGGIGIAATQVNIAKRVFIMDLSSEDTTQQLTVVINPEIIERSGAVLSEEGCLSVPGIFEKVTRAETIKVRYQDLTGKIHQTEYSGRVAICFQHESDHLDGKVFIELLSSLKLNFIRKKLKKINNNIF